VQVLSHRLEMKYTWVAFAHPGFVRETPMTVSQQPPLPYVPGQTSDAPDRSWVAPLLFLLPTVVLLAAYLIYPLLSSFWLSLLHWNGLGENAKFIWFDNWIAMAQDPMFQRALLNNCILAVVSVLVQIPIGLGLAVLLDKAGKRSRILKIIYFLPLLMSSVAVGVLFKNFYDPTRQLGGRLAR
jgi:raffinose/stachyose/melibiose transport system permease protein